MSSYAWRRLDADSAQVSASRAPRWPALSLSEAYAAARYTDRANDTGEWSTPQAADSMLAFYVILFSAFRSSWLNGTDLHLAGESFGGRYLPHFADRIVKHNLQASVASHWRAPAAEKAQTPRRHHPAEEHHDWQRQH